MVALYVNYHLDVLEANIYLGEKLVCSIRSEEDIKQDCETKAFRSLAEKIHKRYKRLPILLMGDSLYASEPVISICEEYGWDYLLRYKDGSIPSIAEEFEAIPEHGKAGHAEFVNEIDYRGHKVNELCTYRSIVIFTLACPRISLSFFTRSLSQSG